MMALKDSTAVIPETRRGAIDIAETRRRFNLKPDRIAAWIALLAGSILMLFPIFWLVTTSLKTKKQIFRFPPVWIPDPIRWQNYSDALRAQPFDRYAMNTLIITVASIFGVLLSSSLVAYAFARLRFPGRDVLFFLILSELMLPQTVTLIPRYIEFREFGWIDTWWPLIVPNYFGNAFFIFLLRQFFRTIPRELSDAAKVDGASEFRIFWQIILPLSRPALTVVAIFTFLYNWNDYLEPLIYISSEDKYTVSLGLANFRDQLSTEWGLLMAGSTMSIVPVVILFFLLQRYFIRGVVLTGLKG
jgi:ABC-type glycerol-3-phosphate transport system permease component